MSRGSRPGERRGGRKRLVPNKRTVLTERILVVAAANPTASAGELFSLLADDKALPADIRLAIARKPVAKTLGGCENLLGVARELTAPPKVRRKAASEMAVIFLPKYPGRKRTARRTKFPADEYGFVIDPKIARELRDAKFRLVKPPPGKKADSYGFARKATKLQERIIAIRNTLQCPCPSKYGIEDLRSDGARLRELKKRRATEPLLGLAEDEEEARIEARIDSYRYGPQVGAKARLIPLQRKQDAIDLGLAEPFTPKEQANFRLLSLLYGPLKLPEHLQGDERFPKDHPFYVERLAEDGNLYAPPRIIEEFVATPPYWQRVGGKVIWLDSNFQPVEFP